MSEIDSNSNSDLGSSCSRPTSPSRSTLLPFVLPPVSSFNFNFYLLFLFIFNSFSVAATATTTTMATATATVASPTPEHPEFSILFNSLKRARVEAFFYNSISRELPMRPWSQRTVGRCLVKNLQNVNGVCKKCVDCSAMHIIRRHILSLNFKGQKEFFLNINTSKNKLLNSAIKHTSYNTYFCIIYNIYNTFQQQSNYPCPTVPVQSHTERQARCCV